MKELPYRLGVGMVLLNDKKQVFVGRRIDTISDAWQMPQGGIDDGESAEQACMRELLEEIGTDKASIVASTSDWLSYDLPDDIQPKIWKGKYRGQKQKWFALSFLGKDSDINIATDHPEFCEWQWVNMIDLPDLIVSFKRELYQNVVSEFSFLTN